MAIDWRKIAKQLGNGGDTYATPTGRRALEIIVGEENIRDAVDYWISQEPGCFAAESVLSILRTKLAMHRCYQIYKAKPDSEDALRAMFLLTSFADDVALPWISEFLNDRKRGIRWNGLMVLRTILDGPLGDAAMGTAMQLLNRAEQDSDSEVRERAREIRSELASRHARW
jgi:HEAT repeat protein